MTRVHIREESTLVHGSFDPIILLDSLGRPLGRIQPCLDLHPGGESISRNRLLTPISRLRKPSML